MSEKKETKLKFYWNLIRGKGEGLNPAKINASHIWAVIQSWFRSILPTPLYIKEQIAWRKYQVLQKSPECLKQGHCIQCGCEIYGKMKADIGCENEPFCYPEMMNKKDWKDYQETNNFKIRKEPI